MNVGGEELLKKVKILQPKFHRFGHIHESYGIETKHNVTFINASLLNEKYEMANLPIEINSEQNHLNFIK